uniref:glutathione peroxidase n=1 Tax=Rousettus aegyptiacus TaxID=9407 RepID=A0A7J8FJ20_ROUAE|nr:hypothetical protein HJG63_012118 [Rousettus aegyptiacus]
MHYKKSLHHLVWSFWASPATNLENRSQETTQRSYLPSSGGFVPNFQLFEKGDVNGEKEQKFYTFLKNSCLPTSELLGSPNSLFWEPMKNHDIRWNFEKFLVGPNGIPIMRWHHRTTVSNVKMDILAYMRRQAAQGVRGK